MLNMQKFHQLIFESPKKSDTYSKALKALTETSPEQLRAMTTDLGWQLWSTQKVSELQA